MESQSGALGGSLDSGVRRQWWREAGLTSRDGWGRAQMSPAGVESQCGVFTRCVGARICPDPISLSIDGVMEVEDVRKLLPDLLATMPEILPFLPVK